MLDLTKFDHVFPASLHVPYDRALQHSIEDHRKRLDGTLFVDRVMRALGISKGRVYPPKSEGALKQLHQLICETTMSIHHKQSLLYYILLDFDVTAPKHSASQEFAAESGMPVNYQIFMKGLWLMDRQDYQEALEYVAHPSLNPDFADDIIIALVRHTPDKDYSLALSYFYSVRPILKTSLALELLFEAMTRSNATEALFFSRTHPQHIREQLFRQWVRLVLEDHQSKASPEQGSELAFMPLNPAEEAWFEEYLLTREGRNLTRAKDTLLIRKITCDRFTEIGKNNASGQWAAVLDGIRIGTGGRAD
ncbi:hypothetical protein CDD83_4201 [Cordyceps sp. RAO-2017]|nr:hypothetical protein CDD83_4201 [Cordyceps sp. RAO-2017]